MDCKTMFEKITDEEERGQVGIGTLIVFIAMVLVAAIAAGVLINTAGFLQSSAEQSGQESQEQVTNRIQVQSAIGGVNSAGDAVDTIELNTKMAPGADDIDLGDATIQYLAPGGAVDLTMSGEDSDGSFTVSEVNDDSDNSPILDDTSDILKITIDLTSLSTGTLAEGESAELQITTESGGESTVRIAVPDSLSGSSAVSL